MANYNYHISVLQRIKSCYRYYQKITPWHLHLFLFGGCLLFLSVVCIHNLIYQLSWILQITCFVVQLPVRTRINNLSANIKTKYTRQSSQLPCTMSHVVNK